MAITLNCPSCSQPCAVAEEHAGAQVRCPHCNAILTVPPLATAAPAQPVDGRSPSVPAVELLNRLNDFFRSVGMNVIARNLFYAGAACLAVMILTTLLPWVSIPYIPATWLGITLWFGILHFLLTGGALGFLTFVVLCNQRRFFDLALWIAVGWSALDGFWRLIDLARLGHAAGVGLILCFLLALSSVGTLGFVAVVRVLNRR